MLAIEIPVENSELKLRMQTMHKKFISRNFSFMWLSTTSIGQLQCSSILHTRQSTYLNQIDNLFSLEIQGRRRSALALVRGDVVGSGGVRGDVVGGEWSLRRPPGPCRPAERGGDVVPGEGDGGEVGGEATGVDTEHEHRREVKHQVHEHVLQVHGRARHGEPVEQRHEPAAELPRSTRRDGSAEPRIRQQRVRLPPLERP